MFNDFMIFWFPFWYDPATRALYRAKRLDRKIKALELKLKQAEAAWVGASAEHRHLTTFYAEAPRQELSGERSAALS